MGIIRKLEVSENQNCQNIGFAWMIRNTIESSDQYNRIFRIIRKFVITIELELSEFRGFWIIVRQVTTISIIHGIAFFTNSKDFTNSPRSPISRVYLQHLRHLWDFRYIRHPLRPPILLASLKPLRSLVYATSPRYPTIISDTLEISNISYTSDNPEISNTVYRFILAMGNLSDS